MKIAFLFAWYDLWVGLFYDKNKSWLYILPIPMFGVIIKLPQRKYYVYSKYNEDVLHAKCTADLEGEYRKEGHKTKAYWSKNKSFDPLFGKPELFQNGQS